MKYDSCVFVGRMQPPHAKHIDNIRYALELSKTVHIVIGSALDTSRTSKNPWTASEREWMVRTCLKPHELERIKFHYIADHPDDKVWLARIETCVGNSSSTAILAPRKDNSTYFVDMLPWDIEEIDLSGGIIHATDIRNAYFADDPTYTKHLHSGVIRWLEMWCDTDEFNDVLSKIAVELL